jgi:hypothetical protein
MVAFVLLTMIAASAPSAVAAGSAGPRDPSFVAAVGLYLDGIADCRAAADPDPCVDEVLRNVETVCGCGFAIAAWLKFKFHDSPMVAFLDCLASGGTPSQCANECLSCARVAQSLESGRPTLPAIARAVAAYGPVRELCRSAGVDCSRPTFWPSIWPWSVAT